MRISFYAAIAVAISFGAGCASRSEPPSTALEVWDCRGDRPKRLSGGDVMAPRFAGMELPRDGKIVDDPDGTDRK